MISVIIPSYNRYELLQRAIRSVQQQTYSNIEIIVVNDCSTQPDYYSGELEKLDNIHVIHLPENQRKLYQTHAAQGKTRQYGLDKAQGEWIAFLDDDDYWVPEKLQIQLDKLRNSDCKMCSTNMMIVNLNNVPIRMYHTVQLPNLLTLEEIRQTCWINNSSVLIHKSVCDQVGSFQIGNFEDYKFWLDALQYTNCYYIDQALVYYTMDQTHSKHYVLSLGLTLFSFNHVQQTNLSFSFSS